MAHITHHRHQGPSYSPLKFGHSENLRIVKMTYFEDNSLKYDDFKISRMTYLKTIKENDQI